ncbi:hypothetical protein [Pelagicoccus sp. SDUM812002]|uniref:hypothetical protein n=1 Tax=Pelagicoccus sp. SDUM812002 TaxID=3041266 RepID=UPI00280E2480|nr:hypothetical protein [Pelagicoccus sp. SDUM812002]MDQ8184852.1 hypothetical protein [Pelagicoccus sp. SDUM812002]
MRFSTIALSLLLVGALAYAGYLQTELSRLKVSLTESPPSSAAASVEAETEQSLASEDTVEEGSSVPSASKESAASVEQEPVSESRDFRRAERMKQMMAAFEDPEMRIDMIERQMNRVDSRYADFFKMLDLSTEDLNTLRTLMAERGVIGWETRMRSFGAETDEAKADVQIARELQQEMLKEQITMLLGEDGAVALKDYSDSLPFRGEVEALASSLSFTNTPLSEDQSEALVGAIRDVSNSFEYTVDLSQVRGRDVSGITPANIETFFYERAARDDLILQAAAETLGDEQLAAYAERQLAERERDRRQMEFMQQNPGGFGRGGPRGGGPRP